MRAIFRASFAARRKACPTPVAKSLGRAALARAFDFMSSSLARAAEIEPGPLHTSLPSAGHSQGPYVARMSYLYRIRPCPPCNYVSEQQTRLAGLWCLLLLCSAETPTQHHRLSRAARIRSSEPNTDRRDLDPSCAGTVRSLVPNISFMLYDTIVLWRRLPRKPSARGNRCNGYFGSRSDTLVSTSTVSSLPG